MTTTPPTDQRAGVRPISFVLDSGGILSEPITLKIRPEDLTRTEPSRAQVHQTLGRVTQGWVDIFGQGLPTVSISGHTGWRTAAGSGMDGVESFEALNKLVMHDYHLSKQSAIDLGIDPDTVKLIFIDMLDGFTYSVVPMNFVLKRNKSRPLLMQYNITLQAVSTEVDNPVVLVPNFGNFSAGLTSLGKVRSFLKNIQNQVRNWIARAVNAVNAVTAPIAGLVQDFVSLSNDVLSTVDGVLNDIRNGAGSVSNRLIGIARDLASVGVNLFRTITSAQQLPSDLKANLGQVSAAYNEVVCLFNNSLRPRQTYENYTGLYGASNCSSTTGGRPDSAYASTNVFDLIQPERVPVTMTTAAQSSTASISRSDPVLAPLSIPELQRHLANITTGTNVTGLVAA